MEGAVAGDSVASYMKIRLAPTQRQQYRRSGPRGPRQLQAIVHQCIGLDGLVEYAIAAQSLAALAHVRIGGAGQHHHFLRWLAIAAGIEHTEATAAPFEYKVDD